MDFLAFLSTAGWIFGPAILLAGATSVVLCWRATRATSTDRDQRYAVVAASAPFALGCVGAVVGFIFWTVAGQPGDSATSFRALGQVILAGAYVSFLPFLWASGVRRARRAMTA